MVRLSSKTSVTYSKDGSQSTQMVLAMPINDAKFKATFKDVTFTKEPQYQKGLVLGVEKPGDFSVDYNVENRAWKFQFDSTTKVLGPPLKLSYTHNHQKHDTTLQGALLLNPATKLTTKWDFDKGFSTLKLSHTRNNTTLEPAYDHGSKMYSFAVTQRVSKKSTLRASYDQKGDQASLEWSRQGSDEGGPIKVTATTKAGSDRPLKITLEKTFNLFF